MRSMRHLVVLLAIGGVSSWAAAQDRLVHRRSGSEPWRFERIVVSPDKDRLVVTIIGQGLTRRDELFWDEVADVDVDEQGFLEPGVKDGLALGDRVWRGHRRLERGDARRAREAFVEAQKMLSPQSVELQAMVVEGLVRSSVLLGDTDSSLAEAAILGELARAGNRSSRFSLVISESEIVDQETFLVPDAPPVLLSDDVDRIGIDARLRQAIRATENGDARYNLWSRLIRRAGPPELAERGLDEGTRFLLRLSQLDSEDAAVRRQARLRLLEDLDEMPAWRIAWVRWFAGSAAIAQAGDDADAALAGVLDLVHVLALEDAAPRVLRRASLGLATETLARIGRAEDAEVLQSILTFEQPARPGTESTP
jgi:hypothetical protein